MTNEDVLDLVDPALLEDVMGAGIGWLHSSEQPDDAVVSHFGVHAQLGKGVGVSFAPTAPFDSSPGSAVVILDAGYGYDANGTSSPRRLTAADVDRFAGALAAAGAEIASHWNGVGCNSGSWAIKGLSPSLAATQERYHAGCPEHHTVFCGRESWINADAEDCPWLSHGHERLVRPIFPEVPEWGPPAPVPAQRDRHLDEVLEALGQLRPVLEELGVVPTTVVPGRRGRVEGDEFVDDEGLAVALPAEAAVRIAAALRSAMDLGAI